MGIHVVIIKKKLAEIDSLLPCASWGSNSGHVRLATSPFTCGATLPVQHCRDKQQLPLLGIAFVPLLAVAKGNAVLMPLVVCCPPFSLSQDSGLACDTGHLKRVSSQHTITYQDDLYDTLPRECLL